MRKYFSRTKAALFALRLVIILLSAGYIGYYLSTDCMLVSQCDIVKDSGCNKSSVDTLESVDIDSIRNLSANPCDLGKK